jgi:hypothetical protein
MKEDILHFLRQVEGAHQAVMAAANDDDVGLGGHRQAFKRMKRVRWMLSTLSWNPSMRDETRTLVIA